MQGIKRDASTPQYVPDYFAGSLHEVDFLELKKVGIKYIAFDADSTLVHFRGKVLPDDTRQLLQKNRHHFKNWCIASNRITNDLLPLAESMDAQVVRASLTNRKPQRRFFRQVINLFGAKPHEIAMIGDKLIADIWGANRMGMKTVWVERIGPDHLGDRIIGTRRFEKRLVQAYLPARQKQLQK